MMLQVRFSFKALFRLSLAVGILLTLLAPGGASVALAPAAAAGNALVEEVVAGTADLRDATVRAALIRLGPSLTMAQRAAAVDLYYRQIIAGLSDLEAFARIAELAAGLAGDDPDIFMQEISRLTLDATDNWQALIAGPWGRLKNRLHTRFPWLPGYPALLRFGSAGFAKTDGSNQVQHVWYSVAVSYQYGEGLAELQARYHEWNAPGLLRHLPGAGHGNGSSMDLTLSRQGMILGRGLAEGTIAPVEVAEWLRTNLGAYTANASTVSAR